MKIRNLALVGLLAVALPATLGCDLKKHAEEVGFKQGDSLLEKGVIKYDHLVDLDEDCNQKWADYQSQLQRRNDLIPQLVSTVKASSAHEEITLIAVTQARASATRPEIQLQEARHNPEGCQQGSPGCSITNDFEDATKVSQFQAAQANLGMSVMAMRDRMQENYPQLAVAGQFHDLMVQMEGTENRILRSREEFNKAVGDFNKDLRHVTGKVINPLTGNEFKTRQYFNADANANVAPTVDFGTPAGAGAVQQARPVK
jgi:LemA protein